LNGEILFVKKPLPIKVGVHISISGSISKSVERAVSLGCDTYQIFTRNPRGWKYSPIPKDVIEEFKMRLSETNINPVVAHMPYLPNLSAPDESIYEKSVASLLAEIERCEQLEIPYLVTHLGSHRGRGWEAGARQLIKALEKGTSLSKHVMILLENTAGTKNSMGTTFEEIRRIMDRLTDLTHIGVCFDTCHAFAAGYELRTEVAVERVMEKFDNEIGLKFLKLIHLNDSVGELGSHLDRHEHIGLGKIGVKGFRAILKNRIIRSRPLILETPVDKRRGDRENIQTVRELARS